MKTLMLVLAGLFLLMLLSGCAGFAPVPDYANMTAAAIKASQERDGIFSCALVPTPWGPTRIVTMDVDKGVVTGRYKYTLNADCSFSIEGEAAQKVKP